MNEIYEKIEETYPQARSSIALGKRHLLFFGEHGTPVLEAFIEQQGSDVQIAIFDYEGKLLSKNL